LLFVLLISFSIIVILLYCILAITSVIVILAMVMPYVQPTMLMPKCIYIGMAQLAHKLAWSVTLFRPVPTFLP